MILKGYDEDGKLAFQQDFTEHLEAVAAFTAEKRDAVKNKVFYLELINPHTPRVESRIYMAFAR